MQPTSSGRKRGSLPLLAAPLDCFQQTTTDQPRQGKRRQLLANNPFVSHSGCVVCQETGLQLVQLGTCRHPVCRGCMGSALLHAFKLQQLPLRCPLPHCRARLELHACVQLLEQQVPGSSGLAAKVLLAAATDRALIPEALLGACPYSDCQVPLELPEDPLPGVPLDCPSCRRAVCSTCRARWHAGLSCPQYQALLGPAGGRARGAGVLGGFSVLQQQHAVSFAARHDQHRQQHQQQAVPLAEEFDSLLTVRSEEGSASPQYMFEQQQQQAAATRATPLGMRGGGGLGGVHQQQRLSSAAQRGTGCGSDGGGGAESMLWSPEKAGSGGAAGR